MERVTAFGAGLVFLLLVGSGCGEEPVGPGADLPEGIELELKAETLSLSLDTVTARAREDGWAVTFIGSSPGLLAFISVYCRAPLEPGIYPVLLHTGELPEAGACAADARLREGPPPMAGSTVTEFWSTGGSVRLDHVGQDWMVLGLVEPRMQEWSEDTLVDGAPLAIRAPIMARFEEGSPGGVPVELP